MGWAFALWFWSLEAHDLLAAFPDDDGGYGAVTKVRYMGHWGECKRARRAELCVLVCVWMCGVQLLNECECDDPNDPQQTNRVKYFRVPTLDYHLLHRACWRLCPLLRGWDGSTVSRGRFLPKPSKPSRCPASPLPDPCCCLCAP